ncbi:SRPBCC family protein [Streptomyces luteogriseus]|uniref:SRPBCC family protein n=1 Tax=Streptomyces luteogriseus TaxID=68233 RepID=UPI003798FC8D
MSSLIQHYKIECSPEKIWLLLEDGRRYLAAVMGSAPAQISAEWPQTGSTAHHGVTIGPVRSSALTVVRHSLAPRELRMEVRAGSLGTLGLDLDVRPWGDAALVTVQEYPLSPQGLYSFAQSLPLMLLLRGRHRGVLFEAEQSQLTRVQP